MPETYHDFLRTFKKESDDANKGDPTISDIFRINLENRMKGLGTQYNAYDYYLTRDEQKSLKDKALDTGADILDFIDNINRPFYALTAGAYEAIKSFKHEDENLSKTLVDVGKAMKRGFSREERKYSRDLLKLIAPETISEIEKTTTAHWFDDKDLNPDALTPVTFAADMLIDPTTYTGVGLLMRIFKGGLGKGAKALQKIGKVFVGEEAVEKTTQKLAKWWADSVSSRFDINKFMKHRELDNVYKAYAETTEGAQAYAVRQVMDAATTKRRKGWLFWKTSRLSNEESKLFDGLMRQTNDEAVEMFANRWSNYLGIKVDDVFKLKELDESLKGIRIAQTVKEENKIIDKMGGIFNLEQKGIKEQIRNAARDGKALRRLVTSLVVSEETTSRELSKASLKTAKIWAGETQNAVNSQMKIIKNELSGGLTSVNKLISNEVKNTQKGIANLDKHLRTLFTKGADEGVINNVKAGLAQLKYNHELLGKYLIGHTNVALKSDETFRFIGYRIKDIEKRASKTAATFSTNLGKVYEKEVYPILKQMKEGLDSFASYRKSELEQLYKKLTPKEIGKLQNEFLKGYHAKAAELTKLTKDASQLLKYEIIRDAATDNTLIKTRKAKVNKLLNAYNSATSNHVQQQFYKSLAKEKEIIFNKYMKDLPKELMQSFLKFRMLLDEAAERGYQGGFLKGISPLYTPRGITNEFKDAFISSFGKETVGAKGFLKKRKFLLHSEMKDWAAQNGIKVETDLMTNVASHLKDFEKGYARHMLEKEVFAKYGVDNLLELKKKDKRLHDVLQYLYREGRSHFDNPWLEMGAKAYSATLNVTKAALTIINPMFYGRNLLGFPLLAASTAGIRRALNPLNYSDALMLKFGGHGSISVGGKKISYDTIRKMADKSGYFASSWTRGDIKSSSKRLLDKYSNYDPRKWIGKVFQFSTAVEDFGRYGALVSALRAGYPLEDFVKKAGKFNTIKGGVARSAEINAKNGDLIEGALNQAKKAMFNYNLINSPFDKTVQGLVGFYTFSRRNLPRQFMAVLDEPKQYAILSRAITKISNREDLSEEEGALFNTFEKSNFKIFGELIDGIREFTALGFTPMEEAYQTLNAITSFDKSQLSGRLNPLASMFLDWWYGKESFYGQDFGNYLPNQYTHVIPEKAAKFMGLTKKIRPVYRAGEIVGEEPVYYGDPDTVFMIRRFALSSRFLNDLGTMLKGVKEGGKKSEQATLKYLTGIKAKELDIAKRKGFKELQIQKALSKKAKARGAQEIPVISVPLWQQKNPVKDMRKKIQKRKQKALRQGTNIKEPWEE